MVSVIVSQASCSVVVLPRRLGAGFALCNWWLVVVTYFEMGNRQTRPTSSRREAIVVYTLGGKCDCCHETYPDTNNGCPATPQEWVDILSIADQLEEWKCVCICLGPPEPDPQILQKLQERYPHLQFHIETRLIGFGKESRWNRDLHITRARHSASPQEQAHPGQSKPLLETFK